MEVFESTNYKECIRRRLKELKEKGSALTFERISEKIGIQKTYLSRIMNSNGHHLNEDHLYELGLLLDLLPHEIDYLILLRSAETSEHPVRRKSLEQQVQDQRKKALRLPQTRSPDYHVIHAETEYLLNPYGFLVYIGLHIPRFKRQPLLLAKELELSEERFNLTLRCLEELGLIELGKNSQIKKLNERRIHQSVDHPLTRTHQQLNRALMQTRLMKAPESKKTTFQVTLTMDRKGFEKAQQEFNQYIQKVSTIAKESKDQGLYQLNFDLLEWVR